jgi:hypothetical protein
MRKIFFILSVYLPLVLTSCGEEAPPVNKIFENNPPIAQDFSIKQLEGKDQVLFVADLNVDSLRGKLFTVALSEEDSVVLRDDGKNGDEVAQDGRFSAIMTDDVNAIQQEIQKSQSGLIARNNLIVFSNRSATAVSRNLFNDSTRFDVEKFQSRSLVKFPKELLLPFITPDPKLKEQSLLIRDISVVEDQTRTFNPCTKVGTPTGVWTFGELMRQLASPSPGTIASDAQASTFILNWLNSWNNPNTVNGELLAARTSIQSTIINPWLQKSQANGAPTGQLKLEFAPFKLMAIVNRLDLRGNSGYGFSNAGEGRFVFCALDPNCTPLQFTVIFEFGINKKSCASVKAFANEWLNLSNLTIGSPAYNTALENITKQFTQSGTNPAKPNQSSLNQLRTNEIALGSPWELREFNLLSTGSLGLTTVKQEPQVKYNIKANNPDVVRMAGWINTNEALVRQNRYTVPDLEGGAAFLGGHALTSFPPTGNPTPSPDNIPHHWDGGLSGTSAFITDTLARHIFSLNTCSACHGGEVQTFFTHIQPSAFGTPAQLSSFLNGLGADALPLDDDTNLTGLFWVQDAAFRLSNATGQPHIRGFNDLERRAIDLANLPSRICNRPRVFALANILQFKPVHMTH